MATKPKKEPREGDYVAGKGILSPDGTYRPTSQPKKPTQGVEGTGYWSKTGWVQGGSSANDPDYKSYTDAGKTFGAPSLAPTGSLAGSTGAILPRNEDQIILGGGYGDEAANAMSSRDSGFTPSTLSTSDSMKLAKEYGLKGMNDMDFAGLTRSEAVAKAKKMQQEKTGQTSALTSYTFNPQAVSDFKKKFDDMKIKIDESTDYPFSNKKEKQDKKSAIVNSYTDQFAGLFNTPDEFNQALQNKDFQKLIKDYERAGGITSDIAGRIGTQSQMAPAQDQYQSPNNQSIDQYLGNIQTPAEQKAFDSLIPEKKVYQDQIAFEQSIPQQYREKYFGTPEQMGILQQRQKQMEEEIKLKERQAKMDEKNARAQADFEIERNNLEFEREAAKTEENRLNAKNYMTGMLAKLGALNTSSSAPIAIAELDAKYQKAASELRSNYGMQNRQIEINLNEEVDNIGLQKDADILKAKSDLSKDEEDVWKEIFKLQNDADRKTFSTIQTYAQEFRSQREKYTKEAKAEAEKYAKSFGSIISTYDLDGIMEGDVVVKRNKTGKLSDKKVLAPQGDLRSVDSVLEASKGSDGYVNSATYKETFDKFIKAGGTRSEFLAAYPPSKFVNPNDKSLPSFLSYAKPSQTVSSKKDDDRTP